MVVEFTTVISKSESAMFLPDKADQVQEKLGGVVFMLYI